jgi:hypothetical protein
MELEKGSYQLTADEGKELIVLDDTGVEIARTKSVIIPVEGTLNNWVEVPEMPKPEPEVKDQVADRIAELERELAILKDGQ